jgi:hypothetical protein
MKKIVLLGGSNSVLQGGLSSGLAERGVLRNLAMSATSSVQNLHALVGHAAEIAACDLVVTESNANDCHSMAQLGGDRATVLGNIDRFYAELAQVNPGVIVLICPIGRTGLNGMTPDGIAAINDSHRANAARFGFHVVDVERQWSSLTDDDLVYAMSDRLHPFAGFMYALGQNIRHHVDDNAAAFKRRRKAPRPARTARYKVITADDLMPGRTSVRSKSRLHRTVAVVDEAGVGFPPAVSGYQVLGVGSWSDAVCALRIGNTTQTVVKAFNTTHAFNEISGRVVVDAATRLTAFQGGRAGLTELSIDVNPKFQPSGSCSLVDLLFGQDLPTEAGRRATPALSATSLDHLTPDIRPFIDGVRFYVQKRRLVPAKIMNAPLMLACAESLEPTAPDLARDLLKTIFRIDPSNKPLRARLKAMMAASTDAAKGG